MIHAIRSFNYILSYFLPVINYALLKIKRVALSLFRLFANEPPPDSHKIRLLQKKMSLYILKKVHGIDEAQAPPLYFAIQEIKKAKSEDLQAGKLDAKVTTCLLRAKYTHNKEALQLLANALFAGERRLHWSRSTPYRVLMALFQKEETKAADLAKFLEEAFSEWKSAYSPTLTRSSSTKSSPWHKRAGIHHNKKICISHGGGLYFLLDFLRGKNDGYIAEIAIKGIWVTPKFAPATSKEDTYYALQTPPSHFDVPCVLTAEIPARFLKALPNTREALLQHEAIKHLKNISIIPVPKNQIKQHFWK